MTTAYVLDPAHIAPSRTDANSNGHFPINNTHGHPTGTPRGFNLGSMPFNPGFPPNMPMPGMPNPPFATMFPPNQPLPGSWINPNAMSGIPGDGESGGHQSGPNRRGGGNRNFGNPRGAGPYDRQGGRDQRNVRWNNQAAAMGGMPPNMMGMGRGGPMGPMMGMPGMPAMGGMRFPGGDGGAGAGAMGPREAVQGRSLKSYEDLDAAGGSGTGELNY